MIFHKLLPLLALALNLLLLGTALAPDRKSHREKVFACLAGVLAWWNLGVFGLRISEDPATALLWEELLHFGVIPIPVLFYHYVLVFLGESTRSRTLLVGYLLCGGFLAVSLSPLFLSGVSATDWGYAPQVGPLYHAFFVYFQAYMVLGLVRLLRRHRGIQSSFRRNRSLLVILGVIVSLVGGVVDFTRFILGWEWLYPVGIPSNAIFALALGVAIVRYRLMDVGVLAKRLLLYLSTSVALAPVVLVGLAVVEQLVPGQHLKGDLRHTVIFLTALAIALPLLRKLEYGLDRLMFQRRHGVRNALVALCKELASILEVRVLGQSLAESLVTQIPLTHASLQLYDSAADAFVRAASASSGAINVPEITIPRTSGLALWLQATGRTLVLEEAGFQAQIEPEILTAVRELEAQRVSMLIPLRLDGELSGVLVLGEKLSGGIFEPEEIELLEMLGGETAVALRNARLYEQLRDQVEEATFLRRYFDPRVFNTIIANPTLLNMRNVTLTICFWDIRGFSRLCEILKAQPSHISGLLREYFAIAAEIIFEYGGVLDKFIGDGVMGLFGALIHPTDEGRQDAVNAVTAALMLNRRFEELTLSWTDRWALYTPHRIDIGLGCGIHTGEALVGNVGTETRDQFTALGPHVNFAQRLEARANKGSILISASTAARVRGYFKLEEAAVIDDVKNIPGEFRVFAVREAE